MMRKYAMTLLTVALVLAAVWLLAISWAGAAEAVDQYATSTPPVCCTVEPDPTQPPVSYPGPLPTREMLPVITWDPYPGPGESVP